MFRLKTHPRLRPGSNADRGFCLSGLLQHRPPENCSLPFLPQPGLTDPLGCSSHSLGPDISLPSFSAYSSSPVHRGQESVTRSYACSAEARPGHARPQIQLSTWAPRACHLREPIPMMGPWYEHQCLQAPGGLLGGGRSLRMGMTEPGRGGVQEAEAPGGDTAVGMKRDG